MLLDRFISVKQVLCPNKTLEAFIRTDPIRHSVRVRVNVCEREREFPVRVYTLMMHMNVYLNE